MRFTDGSTPEYEAAISLNDGSSCVRFTPGGLGDESCNKLYNFTCMSDPIDKGILFILSGEFRTSQRVAPTRKGASTIHLPTAYLLIVLFSQFLNSTVTWNGQFTDITQVLVHLSFLWRESDFYVKNHKNCHVQQVMKVNSLLLEKVFKNLNEETKRIYKSSKTADSARKHYLCFFSGCQIVLSRRLHPIPRQMLRHV